MTTLRMEVYGGRNYVTPLLANIDIVAPGVGKMTCLECDGDPEGYAAAFPAELAAETYVDGIGHTCRDCKGRGWVYVNV